MGTPAIEVRGLSKRFGDVAAVTDLSFAVERGTVTGFLGPNGAGKTTTLRMVLGLARPDAGQALIEGRHYAELADPVRTVGAVLESNSFHPGRSARDHVRIYCIAAGIPVARADEVLELVGLTHAACKRAGGFSLGMRQRLALATALIGEPSILILDEPTNGLDPEGIAWLRSMLRSLATGRDVAVLVSSHLLAEVEQTVDRVVIVSSGRLVRQGTIADLAAEARPVVVVGGADAGALRAALRGLGDATVSDAPDGRLRVIGATPEAVGHAAWAAGVELHHLVGERPSLERLFLELTGPVEGAA